MLAFEFLRLGIDFCLLTGNAPRSVLAEAAQAKGACIEVLAASPPVAAIGWEWMAFSRSEALYAHLGLHRTDLVHCFSHDTVLAAAIAIPAAQIPLIATFSEVATNTTAFGSLRTRFVTRVCADARFVVASEYFRDALLRQGVPAERIDKVVVGVDVQRWGSGDAERGRALLGLPPEVPLVVCPSRFTPRKGQVDLVHALARLRERVPAVDCRLLFTGSVSSGSPAYLDEVRRLVTGYGLSDPVMFRLEEDREMLPHLFAAADVVVQPSHYEGLGTAALEAMAAGSCVLLTQTPALWR